MGSMLLDPCHKASKFWPMGSILLDPIVGIIVLGLWQQGAITRHELHMEVGQGDVRESR